MLVLTRNTSQKILIGDAIEIKVLSVHGNQVRLGINAPRQLGVHREEVYDRIQKENSSLKND